jgi:N-acetylmuramoyl-L-alanine amidase
MHKKPLKSAGFRVLRAPDVPSVLVELGYVSNRQDLQSLLSETWRSRTADSIAQAIETFLSSQIAGGAHTGSN